MKAYAVRDRGGNVLHEDDDVCDAKDWLDDSTQGHDFVRTADQVVMATRRPQGGAPTSYMIRRQPRKRRGAPPV